MCWTRTTRTQTQIQEHKPRNLKKKKANSITWIWECQIIEIQPKNKKRNPDLEARCTTTTITKYTNLIISVNLTAPLNPTPAPLIQTHGRKPTAANPDPWWAHPDFVQPPKHNPNSKPISTQMLIQTPPNHHSKGRPKRYLLFVFFSFCPSYLLLLRQV